MRIRDVENRLEELELFVKSRVTPVALTLPAVWDGDFRAFPPTLRVQHIAFLYDYSIATTRKMAAKHDPKIPTPSTSRPFGWNRADVERHYKRRYIGAPSWKFST